MPKLELKPWMLDRPQVILVNRYDGSKLFACFCKNEAGEIYRKVWEQQKRRNGDKLIYPLDEISLADWIDDFLDLLGIPETIEEKTAVNEPQPHTIQGQRGQQIITLKDIQIAECFLRGMLDAATYYGKDNDYSPTEKLNFDDLIEIIYEVRWMENFDPVAIVQSACCHMEKAMGIYPNIPPLIEAKNENL